MKKFIFLGVLILAALVGYHFFASAMKGGGMPPMGGAMPVSTATANLQDVIESRTFSGRMKAVDDAEIRAQVGGTIEKILFKEGDMVKAGQPLFALDARSTKAGVQQAEASFTEAKLALDRGKVLFAEKVISSKDMETRAATYQRASAALAQAKVNLDYSTIKSPVDGKVGRADVTVGNVVAPGTVVLTTVQSIAPIYVDFDIDEQTYLTFVKMKQAGDVSAATVMVGLATDGNDYPLEGTLDSTDNRLDPSTGSLRARAVLPNADGSLIPGLFARVKVSAPGTTQAVLVNDAAVATDQSKRFVYVVGADNKATYREVHLGGMVDGLRIVKKGLQGGEVIIVNGLMRVHPGAEVVPVPVDMHTLSSATTVVSATSPVMVSASAPVSGTAGAAASATPTDVSGTVE